MGIYDEYRKKLTDYYDRWDYEYKPSKEFFLDFLMQKTLNVEFKEDFLEELEKSRSQAYYSSYQAESNIGFDNLACLIQYAICEGIKTPYDHVIKGDRDFEYKLNHLHLKRK